MRPPESTSRLFLEKVVKGTPRIFDRVGSGRGLALDARTQGKRRAIVVQVLPGIAGHVRSALDPATRVELHALLTGMQGDATLHAFPIWVNWAQREMVRVGAI